MGSFLLKKAVGLSNISDLLDKSGIFYNYSTKVLPSFDYDTAGKHIAREDSTWNGKYVIGQPAEVTYSFPKWEGKFNQFGNKNPYEFNELQKEHARKSLDACSDIANIKFTEVAVGNVDGMKASDVKTDITFGNIYDPNGTFQAYATLPNTYAYGKDLSGQAWFSDYHYAGNTTPELGNYGRLTIIHEIGHTLGLMHPGDYNAGQNVPGYLKSDYAEDSRQYTVMSYWDEYETGAHFQGAYAGAPLLHDISAMQYLYGANTTTRTGDDVYGFNSNTGIDYYTATDSNDKLIFSVWDSGGNDTFDFSGFYQDQLIDLRAGNFSDVGGLQKNVSIAQNVTIENAIGGFGNDIIHGNDADNTLIGGEGDDIIYGHSGNNTIYGGRGQDTLHGGTGSNTFIYKEIADSLVTAADKIMDFKTGIDKIDLSTLIQDTFSSKILNFVDNFTGNAGEATLSYNEVTNASELAINAYGYNYNPDFKIDIVGFVNYETDFIV